MPIQIAQEISINYIGVLKDILELDYGLLHTPVILLKCKWMKRVDNQGNNTYTRDEAGFLVVNFCHKLPRLANPLYFWVRLFKFSSMIFKINLVGRWFYAKRLAQNGRCWTHLILLSPLHQKHRDWAFQQRFHYLYQQYHWSEQLNSLLKITC